MLVPASGVVRDKHSFVDRLLYSSFLFLRVSNWEVMSDGQNLFSMIKPEYIQFDGGTAFLQFGSAALIRR
jgi:hypothetical protein